MDEFNISLPKLAAPAASASIPGLGLIYNFFWFLGFAIICHTLLGHLSVYFRLSNIAMLEFLAPRLQTANQPALTRPTTQLSDYRRAHQCSVAVLSFSWLYVYTNWSAMLYLLVGFALQWCVIAVPLLYDSFVLRVVYTLEQAKSGISEEEYTRISTHYARFLRPRQ